MVRRLKGLKRVEEEGEGEETEGKKAMERVEEEEEG